MAHNMNTMNTRGMTFGFMLCALHLCLSSVCSCVILFDYMSELYGAGAPPKSNHAQVMTSICLGRCNAADLFENRLETCAVAISLSLSRTMHSDLHYYARFVRSCRQPQFSLRALQIHTLWQTPTESSFFLHLDAYTTEYHTARLL
jgi:hypothetical protein